MLCGLAMSATSAFAEETTASPAVADTAVEEVVVTGSRISRPDLVANTPVLVVGQERLEGQGLENIADVLVTLPQFSPSFGGSRTQSTFSGTQSSGLNSSNLRNLGANRSLTLINGRRAPSGIATLNAVDLNLIPSANISRIEVLTGGASAIYGADAVAGVVNIITDRSLNGLEVGASYGASLETKDNINPSGFLRWGKVFDEGFFSTTLQYDYQGEVMCADRYICETDFIWNPPGAPLRGPAAYSTIAPQGTFSIGGPGGGANPFNGSFTARNGSFQQTPTAANPNGVIPFVTATDGFNRNQYRTVAQPTERILFAAEGAYEVFDGVTFFTELNGASSDTYANLEAPGFASNTNLIAGITEATIPLNNPFIPANIRAQMIAAGDNELTWSQRLSEVRDRGSTNERTTYRGVVGLRGDLDSIGGFGSDWNWEASYTYGKFLQDGKTEGSVSLTAMYEGLRVESNGAGGYQCANVTARALGCVPINPFDGYDAPESNYLLVDVGLHGEQEMEQGLAYLSGSLFNLPAGPVKGAIGFESNRVTASLDYSEEINQGTTTGNRIGDNPEQTFRTNEVYVEGFVPVLADMPFAKSLNLEGAYRWSSSSRFGDYQTWRIGGDWSPVDGVRFRVGKNLAVRAPVLGEVSGIGQTFGNVTDPCTTANRNANATRAANCLADGIPANYAPPPNVLQGVGGFNGGNADLKPEEAETLTYGVVIQAGRFGFTPEWLSSLNIQIDRFDIQIDGLINTIGRQNILNYCYDTAGAGRNVYCQNITRGTDPRVIGATWVLTAIDDQLQNIASTSVSGVDLQIDYNVGLDSVFGRDLGTFSFSAAMTFYDKAELINLPGTPALDLLGYAGGSTSTQGYIEKQGNFTFNWAYGPVRTTWVARYIGEAGMHPSFPDYPRVDAHTYHDVRVNWEVLDNVNLYAGMNNLFDKEPPLFASSASGTQALDTIPGYYDVFGRQAYIGFRAKF